MKHNFYDSKKILYILISILILIQFGAFSVQIVSNRKIAKDTVIEELALGAQVFIVCWNRATSILSRPQRCW